MSCVISKARRLLASKNGATAIRHTLKLAPIFVAIVALGSRSGA
jgi:Flp pilus assembly pilin Flp